MKAISIWQPWASAIAVGTKHYETRSWEFPKSMEGEIIAIHASKRCQGEERELATELRFFGINIGFEPSTEKPPLGSIVAVGRLVECVYTEALYGDWFAPSYNMDNPREVEYLLGNFAPGRFAWKLEDVVRLAPIPCIGRQGFWNLEPEVIRAIREQAIIDTCPFSGRLCHPGCDRLMCGRASGS